MDPLPNIPPREPGLASTAITNQLSEALNQFGRISATGQVDGVMPTPILYVKVSTSIAGGRYNGKLFKGDEGFAATGNLAEGEFGTLPAGDNCIVIDSRQIGLTTARPLEGGVFRVVGVDGWTSDGKPKVVIESSVQGVRLKPDYTQLQVTFLGNPSGDSDWVDTVQTHECEETS